MKRILIIEDDRSIAELERDYLESHGFEADIETRGDAGLKRALQAEYDLIVLDVMLPGIDGFDICRQIRQRNNIPILLVSAKKDEIDKIRGLGLGADDYLTKPFSPGELVARVKAHLSRYERLTGEKTGGERISIRGLLIDKPARKVTVNGEEVPLTGKEYDLLLYMASHPNRVFEKHELFERVWGMDSAGDIATVTVHIRRLREKIEMEPSNPQYIETIWGVGYRFKV
ncbi:two-component system response regulator [Paenibacillus sp. 32O-W]|jgi:DNA-binding response OmpR family regulator|uniref:DNA-binding response regulator n=1 Tax=Paenibacillus cisolokensis TaxID=1658519 RepID=A0ABQ4NAG9_9BACL|nr:MULTISPECIES: response regulator transcription factor [Paenibacillus]ALS27640.1 two-component system response regulator [Paenibacillus sp. 32O-W]GIQ65227.1 DNA-binding response regulator [Paenibacillus cisolokensis]